MFQIVLQQLLEDQQRSNRVVSYALCHNLPVYGAVLELYNLFTKSWEGDLNDTTLALQITDGIYLLIPSLL